MIAAVDLQTRDDVVRNDPGRIVEQIVEGTEALHAFVSGWPLRSLPDSHIIATERSIVALQDLLVRLKQATPKLERAA